MPPVFATPDIAALVAAYPPSEPTREHPSVVRSLSGNNIQSSDVVISRFRSLLETSPGRIELADLPEQLDIERKDWLFDVYDDPIYYSADGKSILSNGEVQALRRRLRSSTTTGLVDSITFAHDCDIDDKSLSLLAAEEDKRRPGEIVEYVDSHGGDRRWMYSGRYASAMQGAIASTLSTVEGSAPINLSHDFMFSDAPRSLIHDLTQEVLAKNDKIRGSVELRKRSVVFVPADFADAQEQKRKDQYQKQVDELIENFSSKGYCIIPLQPESHGSSTVQETRALLLRDVQSQLLEKHTPNEWFKIGNLRSGDDGTAAIVSRPYFDELCQADQSTESIIAQLWESRDGTKTDSQFKSTAIQALAESFTSDPLLASLISKPGILPYTKLEAIVASSTTDLEQKDVTNFYSILSTQLLAPLALYTTGVNKAQDQTLNENLSTFVSDHFRREIIPNTLAELRTKRLLIDRTRAKETDKFSQAASASRSLAELQAAIAKLERKLKLSPLDSEQLEQIRDQTLRHKANAIQRMTRSSDVLQNLIWILLSERAVNVETNDEQSFALFMSSGKDTTRMIKLYQALASDSAVGARLEAWRDKLKAGNESPDDVREMKEMAMKTVDGMSIAE